MDPNNLTDSTLSSAPQVSTASFEQSIVTEAPQTPEPPKKSKKGLIIFTSVIFLVILFIFSGMGVTIAVAYEKVSLGQETDQKIRQLVLSIPFMPKTPRYVLEKTLIAHQELNSHRFDASLALESDSFAEQFGLNTLDLQVKGGIDYNNLENVQFDVETNVTKDFNAFVRKLDSEVFIKINKLPVVLSSLIGVNSEEVEEIFKDWIVYDIKPLDTSAREALEKDNTDEEEGSATNKIVKNLVEALTDGQIVNKIQISETEEDGLSLYVLKFTAAADDIDYFDQKLREASERENYENAPKLSEILKNLQVEVKVGRADGLVRSVSTLADLDSEEEDLSSMTLVTPYIGNVKNMKIAFVLKLDNFNSEIKVDRPDDAVSFEEFWNNANRIISESTTSGSLFALNTGRQFSQARDAQRRSDLLQVTNAIYQYAVENNGNLPGEAAFPTSPTCIGTSQECLDLAVYVVPTYIAEIPKDPSFGTDSDTGYTIYVNSDGRVVAQAQGEITSDITVER